jgi:Zn finger protein HypA/HybF involved in hydrogenase expression
MKLKELKCLRCGKKWLPRTEDVRICPRCKSAWWNVAKKTKEGKK